MTTLAIIAQNHFISGILQFLGILFTLGAIPAVIKYIAIKISWSFNAPGNNSKSKNPFEKYEHYISVSAYSKEMFKSILKTKVPIFSLFIIGVTLLIVGSSNLLSLPKDTANIIATIGTFMAIGFFAIYGIRFYAEGGWRDAGKAFNSMYLKYAPKRYVTEEEWESVDGGPWKKRSSRTEDKNAPLNVLTWVLNLLVTFIKLSMSATYVALTIFDDLYLIVKHILLYKFIEKYYTKKAREHYVEFIETFADLEYFKVCNSFFTDERLNTVAQKVHAEYLKKTLECIKNGSENFVVFASDLSVGKWYTNTRVNKRLGTGKFGDKTIYVFEGKGCRVYVCSTDNPDPSNPFELFAHAFPTMTKDNDYLKGFMDVPDMIGYLRLYQSIFLSLVKKTRSGDKAVNLYKIDEATRTIAIVSAQLKDIEVKPLPELTEENASKVFTDEDFYVINDLKVLHEFSIGAKAQAPAKSSAQAQGQKKNVKVERVEIKGGAFSVHLVECGEEKLEMIKVIRKYTEHSITQIKSMLENVPISILDAVSEDIASTLVDKLTALGAKAEIQATPNDIAEQVKAEREKNRQRLVSLKSGNSANKAVKQVKKANNKRSRKAKKTHIALALSFVILSLVCVSMFFACFFSGIIKTPLPDLFYYCTPPLLTVWAIIFAIVEVHTFNKSHSKGKRIAGGILLLITALILTTLLSFLAFTAKFMNMTDDEVKDFFSPLITLIGDPITDPQTLRIIFPVSAGITSVVILATILASTIVANKLRKPKK